MTQQSQREQRDATDDQTSDSGERKQHAANRRVAKLRGGLEKAVTGREAQIKAQALKWAEQLDERWQGRHHNKLHVALMAVEFLVDRASKGRDGDTAANGDGDRNRDRGDAAENLGEFRNLSDEARDRSRDHEPASRR